ncbi:MAG: hypothetical protein U9Q69_00910 [Nanoarchaeota archaeon]|nr:hypothetical protein [Nanoarchaeota archaeon]
MFSWLFKKKREDINHLHSKINHGFQSVWNDMTHVGKWIEHFKDKHGDNEKMFHLINRRLTRIESSLEEFDKQTKNLDKISDEIKEGSFDEMEISSWDSLTNTLQKICWQLAAIQKELPNQWVSLKYLAQEMYPDKQYNRVRSTLSQYISSLEELGYVKRTRKGKQAYILSTTKNPCFKKSKKSQAKIKIKQKK